MRRDLQRRLERLEAADAQRVVAWIGPPEGGLAGWEIVGGDAPVHVWRRPGEGDEDLQARAAVEANRQRGMIVVFGMDDGGMTR